jgi:hypothetical protein
MDEIPHQGITAQEEPNRDSLKKELDAVIEHHFSRLNQGLTELRRVSERIYEDYRVLASSFELQRRTGGGARNPKEGEFDRLELPQGLFRWLQEERHAKEAGSLRAIRRHGPVKPPEGRVEQILDLLTAAGRSMTTDEIVEVMVSRGLLEGVADPRATVSAALSRGTRTGFLDRPSRGIYTVPRPDEEPD